MNWISNVVRPKIRSFLKRETPENLWIKCPETGQLVAMFWTHDRAAGRDIANHIVWGTADGRVWTEPVATPLHGQHCQPIAVGGDRLVALYVHRQDPPSLRAALSPDFGRTWPRDAELVFYDSAAGTESGMQADPRAFEEFWQDMMAWRFCPAFQSSWRSAHFTRWIGRSRSASSASYSILDAIRGATKLKGCGSLPTRCSTCCDRGVEGARWCCWSTRQDKARRSERRSNRWRLSSTAWTGIAESGSASTPAT